MSLEITTAFVQQFSNNILLLAQQDGSRLRDRVTTKMITGNAAYFERVGPTDVVAITTRHGDSPMVDTPHSRRRVTTAGFEWGDMVDQLDEVQMLIDPKSTYVQNAMMAFGRHIDRIILAAATGTAVAVTSSLSGTTSNVSFDSANIVDEDFGTVDSNLTIPKLIEARRILMKNEAIVPGEELTCVVNSSMLAALLNTTQVTSADYNTVRALVKGEIDTFLGMKFIQTELVTGSLSSSPDPKIALVFPKSAIGLAINKDITAQIAQRADKRFSWYAYASMMMGAVRIEEAKIVQIECYQTA